MKFYRGKLYASKSTYVLTIKFGVILIMLLLAPIVMAFALIIADKGEKIKTLKADVLKYVVVPIDEVWAKPQERFKF